MRNIYIPFLYIILVVTSCGKCDVPTNNWVPVYKYEGEPYAITTGDLITTPKAAAIVAKGVVKSVYGERCADEEPYVVSSNQNCWFVRGSLPNEDMAGGTFFVVIRKHDGKIERTFHEK